VDGRFLIITTTDGGKAWNEMPAAGMPTALTGEGAFAASGTCIAVRGKEEVWFGTGGPGGARVFRSTDGGRNWTVATTGVTAGKAAGIFSLLLLDAKHGVAVGGDYTKESEAGNNAAWTKDGGKTWHVAETTRPNGYRSGVAHIIHGRRGRTIVAVGPSGSDYSLSGGQTWLPLGREGFHSLSFAPNSTAGWAVGENGRIAKYTGALREAQGVRK
jgi:photosystem II stability/assembly factor-like uncharacterized protein